MIKRFLTLAATAALLTGCYHTAFTTAPQTNTLPQTNSVPAPQQQSGAEASLEMKNFAFSPKQVTVKPGAKVTITNNDIAGHTLTSDDGKSFDTKLVAQGQSATITAPTTPGSYPWHCTPHPNMKGILVVNE